MPLMLIMTEAYLWIMVGEWFSVVALISSKNLTAFLYLISDKS